MTTQLKCSVYSCAANDDSLCVLHTIQVEGCDAKTKSETTCGSFISRDGAPTNSVADHGTAEPETKVQCEATDCTYNTHKLCSADSISVQGDGTQSANDTLCATFEARH